MAALNHWLMIVGAYTKLYIPYYTGDSSDYCDYYDPWFRGYIYIHVYTCITQQLMVVESPINLRMIVGFESMLNEFSS